MASEPSSPLSNIADDKSNNADGQAEALAIAFGRRLQKRAEEKGLTSAEIGRLAEIKKQTMTGYWNGARLCGSEKLFQLADVLDVSARWLLHGDSPQRRSLLVDAEEADWVSLPRYDLLAFTPEAKPEPLDTTVIRRDWLNNAYGRSSGLWLTQLPASVAGVGDEGEVIVCGDVADEPIDGRTYIFLINGSPAVRRFRQRGGDQLDEIVITAEQLARETGGFFPIGRVLGKLAFQRL